MTTLGKYLAGGLTFRGLRWPCGFDGRVLIPTPGGALGHAGTFNNNVASMAAGVAALTEVLHADVLVATNQRGDDLRDRLNAVFAEHDMPMCVTGVGSLMNVHGTPGPVHTAGNLVEADDRLKELLFFHLLDAGIYIARRGFIALSIEITDADVDTLITAVRQSAIPTWWERLDAGPTYWDDEVMSGVQSVERALALLREIGQSPGGLVDLSERTGLATSTAARLLSTLEAEGAVRRDGAGVYLIGPDLVAMAGPRSGSDIVSLARRHMTSLSETLGEAVALSVPSGATTTTIEQIDAPKPVRAEDWTGTVVPVHAGCVGLVTMAFWKAADVEAYLDDDLETFTDSTVVDAAVIRSRLDRVRRGDMLWTHGEYVEGISSVAAPILNELGHAVAALYAYGPSYRFPPPGSAKRRSARTIATAVAERASGISQELGWARPGSPASQLGQGAA